MNHYILKTDTLRHNLPFEDSNSVTGKIFLIKILRHWSGAHLKNGVIVANLGLADAKKLAEALLVKTNQPFPYPLSADAAADLGCVLDLWGIKLEENWDQY